MSAELDRRVRESFPIGSAMSQVEAKLENQGFYPSIKGGLAMRGETFRVRREDKFPCDQAAYVYWRADGNERLTSIRGDYREEGCL